MAKKASKKKSNKIKSIDFPIQGTGNETRSFCFIDDAVEILRRLVSEPKAACGTFNLGNQEQEVSIGEVARIVLGATGRKDLEIVPLPETEPEPSIGKCF